MRHGTATFAGLILSMSLGSHSLARPALGIKCSATDTDFKFEMIINEFSGDLFPGTFILSEHGKQVPTEVKQYSNYKRHIIMVISKGPQGDDDDIGYIIDLSKSYNGSYYGDATLYIANPPGTRDEQNSPHLRLECQIRRP